MIALGRDYPSIFGAPVVRAVDERIFCLRYFARCMDCTFCGDQCCDYGVDIDAANMDRLRGLGTAFESFAGVPQSGWFTPELTEDAEFPSGRHGRTRSVDGKCVFADRKGRGCRIHAWCLQNGLDYHLLKPMVSILFPVTFELGVLVPSPEAVDASLICSGQGDRLYEGVRDEIGYYFGEELVTALDVLMSTVREDVRAATGVPATR
jgi:hypothetical protein